MILSPAVTNNVGLRVELVVLENEPPTDVIVAVGDPGFYATPYFWLAPPFQNWPTGHGERYLTNGGRPDKGQFCRFTPDLAAGTYEVSLAEETPFEQIASFRREASPQFDVAVRHALGDTGLRVEPLKSRSIGTFPFNEGTDGYVQVFAANSVGQVLIDAVRFRRIGD